MVERINGAQSREVARLRSEGKTDRQVEKIVGLTSGLLSRGFIIDAYDDRANVEAQRIRDEIRGRGYKPPPKHKIIGWRPDGNCVQSRPDAKPLRSSQPVVSRHAEDY